VVVWDLVLLAAWCALFDNASRAGLYSLMGYARKNSGNGKSQRLLNSDRSNYI
jgi:hypothetical protein